MNCLGSRRWAETDYDFGSEPDDEPYAQVWSCDHAFEVYELPSDNGFNYGDFHRMECNRCFEHIHPPKMSHPLEMSKRPSNKKRPRIGRRAKKIGLKTQNSNEMEAVDDHTALECSYCRLLVCPKCRDKYLEQDGSGGTG